MNRRDNGNGVTVMNTPRRAFGELKNLAYAGTPRSIDSLKARSNVLGKNVEKVFIEDAPFKKATTTTLVEIPAVPLLHRLKKADSLEELCNIAGSKKSFAVYNDSDSEIETFGEKEDSLKDFCINQEESIILTEDYEDLLGNTLSTIDEVEFDDMDDEDGDADCDEDLEVEVPFAGGCDNDIDTYTHIPESLVLNDDLDVPFYSSHYYRSEDENVLESDDDSSVCSEELPLREAALAEMMTRVSFEDFVC